MHNKASEMNVWTQTLVCFSLCLPLSPLLFHHSLLFFELFSIRCTFVFLLNTLQQEHKHTSNIIQYKHISWKYNKGKAKLHMLQVQIKQPGCYLNEQDLHFLINNPVVGRLSHAEQSVINSTHLCDQRHICMQHAIHSSLNFYNFQFWYGAAFNLDNYCRFTLRYSATFTSLTCTFKKSKFRSSTAPGSGQAIQSAISFSNQLFLPRPEPVIFARSLSLSLSSLLFLLLPLYHPALGSGLHYPGCYR